MTAMMLSRALGVDDGEVVSILGNTVTIKVTGAQSGGTQAILVYEAAPGFVGPPLHRHDFDEYFYVLDGELQFRIGAETVVARAGESVFAARGEAHTYANPGDRPATCLITLVPSGFEFFFAELAARLGAPDAFPPAILAELNHKYGVEMIEAYA